MPINPAKVIAARKAAGMTQAELATAGGLTQQEVDRVENGGRLTPRVDTLARFAVGLGVSMESLMDMPKPRRRRRQAKQ